MTTRKRWASRSARKSDKSPRRTRSKRARTTEAQATPLISLTRGGFTALRARVQPPANADGDTKTSRRIDELSEALDSLERDYTRILERK